MKRQILRFLIVGCLNTGVSYSVYASLVYLGLPYVAANLGAVTFGILFSFRTQGRFVFHNPDRRLLFRYAAFWLLIFLVNTGLIYLLIKHGLNEYSAGAIALVPTAALSFVVQKWLVFYRKT